MAPVPAVCIENVHKRFGAVKALHGVSFNIAQGEFFGLLGPNGAGKSTLINALAGLTRADRGQLNIMGYDVVREYRRARMSVGVVPQELVYDPFFTVREFLRFQSGYFGVAKQSRQWVDELLEVLDLTEKADVNMRALSGGMKRRVLIGQALVHKPPVVVLDEPTAGVDVELRQQLWFFIRRLHQEGHTIVLTTHYLEEAEQLCERIAIIDRGELIALDTKSDLLARGIFRSLHVVASRDIESVPVKVRDKVKAVHGCSMELRLRRDSDSVVEVLDTIRGAGIDVRDIHMEDDDLEDVFIQLTRRSPASETSGGSV
ncbi:MAG: putative ABC transporter ATP-binding protein YadG [Gammaproteobacteria bacterium]|nr:putative ABC transporter ATP-binding protein YadG [Gammaproteobacteria bacterium]